MMSNGLLLSPSLPLLCQNPLECPLHLNLVPGQVVFRVLLQLVVGVVDVGIFGVVDVVDVVYVVCLHFVPRLIVLVVFGVEKESWLNTSPALCRSGGCHQTGTGTMAKP